MNTPELRGFSAAVGQALKSQRDEFESRLAALAGRVAYLERVLAELAEPAGTARSIDAGHTPRWQ